MNAEPFDDSDVSAETVARAIDNSDLEVDDLEDAAFVVRVPTRVVPEGNRTPPSLIDKLRCHFTDHDWVEHAYTDSSRMCRRCWEWEGLRPKHKPEIELIDEETE